MRRVWHPYTAWEEVAAGMWRSVGGDERRRLLPEAIAFTGDHERYGSYMLRVLNAWPISCEHNLSDTGQNRKAPLYIGTWEFRRVGKDVKVKGA